jgi:hypothetical protein
VIVNVTIDLRSCTCSSESLARLAARIGDALKQRPGGNDVPEEDR